MYISFQSISMPIWLLLRLAIHPSFEWKPSKGSPIYLYILTLISGQISALQKCIVSHSRLLTYST